MSVRGVILDVDGTVVRGDEPLPGAAAGLAAIDDAGLRRLFVSNNPTRPPEDYERRLGRAGFDVDTEEVITAGSVSARYLADHHADDRVAVVGDPGLVDLLREAGLSVVTVGADADGTSGTTTGRDAPAVDVLVASIDREFHYRTLRNCLRVLDDPDVTFLGTDPDVVIPAPEEDLPGSGAMIDAIANVVGRDPAAILGKPSRITRDAALERLGLVPEEVLVVGDRLDTDVALAEGSGMRTALVRTGVTDDADLEASPIRPDHVLDSLSGLEAILPRPG
jgi:4-nitrophenyl phosphatase